MRKAINYFFSCFNVAIIASIISQIIMRTLFGFALAKCDVDVQPLVLNAVAFGTLILFYSILSIYIGGKSYYLEKQEKSKDFYMLQVCLVVSAIPAFLVDIPKKWAFIFSYIFRPFIAFKYLFANYGLVYSIGLSIVILILISFFTYRLGQKLRGYEIAKEAKKAGVTE